MYTTTLPISYEKWPLGREENRNYVRTPKYFSPDFCFDLLWFNCSRIKVRILGRCHDFANWAVTVETLRYDVNVYWRMLTYTDVCWRIRSAGFFWWFYYRRIKKGESQGKNVTLELWYTVDKPFKMNSHHVSFDSPPFFLTLGYMRDWNTGR